mgnify:CR=1 FL=1
MPVIHAMSIKPNRKTWRKKCRQYIEKRHLSFLAGDNMGPSKLEKAQQLNIPIKDENEFLAMIEEE